MTLRPPANLHQYRGSVRTVAPVGEPVTVAEMQAMLVTDQDAAMIGDMIAEAREYIERIAGVALLTQTWRLALDHWPQAGTPWWDGVREIAITELSGSRADLHLPVWPLRSVDTVTVYNDAGDAQAVNIANTFDIDTYQTPGRLALRYGATWPIALRRTNAIEIVYQAGYGNAAQVPGPWKRAIKQMVARMYSHRGDGCDAGNAYEVSGAQSIVGAFKVARV